MSTLSPPDPSASSSGCASSLLCDFDEAIFAQAPLLLSATKRGNTFYPSVSASATTTGKRGAGTANQPVVAGRLDLALARDFFPDPREFEIWEGGEWEEEDEDLETRVGEEDGELKVGDEEAGGEEGSGEGGGGGGGKGGGGGDGEGDAEGGEGEDVRPTTNASA